MKWKAVKKRMRKKKSQRDYRPQNPTDVVTVIMTDLVDLHHHVTDAVAHPDGGAGLQRGEVCRPGETAIGARAPADTAAGPETDATAQNPLVTTEATDIAATQSRQKGVLKRVTRRVEEETSDLSSLKHILLFGNLQTVKDSAPKLNPFLWLLILYIGLGHVCNIL